MKNEGFEDEMDAMVNRLVDLARSSSNNSISSNCLFAICDYNEYKLSNTVEQRKKRKAVILGKKLLTFNETIEYLRGIYYEIYDITMFVFKSTPKLTIVEVQLFMKKSLPNKEDFKSKDVEPILHSKVLIPPYANRGERKFDINWQLGGLKHELNMIRWRIKYYFHQFNKVKK